MTTTTKESYETVLQYSDEIKTQALFTLILYSISNIYYIFSCRVHINQDES